jgi:hypothetical protein
MDIKKVENDRKFIGSLLDYYLDKSIRYFNDIDDAFLIHDEVVDFLEKKARPIDPFPGFEQLLEDDEFLDSEQCTRILKRFVRNVDVLRLDRLEFWKDGQCVDHNVRYIDIWEDDLLPHYFILHNEPRQAYLLLDRESGSLLPWRFHVLCPSSDKNIIIGEHLDEPFDNRGICAIRLRDRGLEDDMVDGRTTADPVPFETLMPGISPDDLPFIFPFGTNVPHLYIPLRSVQDIMFRHRMQELMNADDLDDPEESPDEEASNKYKDQPSVEDDGLPF